MILLAVVSGWGGCWVGGPVKAAFQGRLGNKIYIYVSEALFPLCRGTYISTLFGGVSDFPVTYHGYYSFLSFLSGFLFCWCEENTGRHFKGFLFYQNKRMQNNNTGGIKCGTQSDTKII